ncbi:hypothetical protein [Methanococcoides sp. NM1]|uniref:hypothetical protein n=1 Tax=Methanococcoides sp. NM1 TaxID=1201013 RepID=UPI001FCEC206|nr:hypothetical protein [Methanococcoides sp. NM1]
MNKMWLILLIAITMVAAGCAGNDAETTTYTDDDVEVTLTTPEDAEGQWCPVGSTWDAVNPQTGESMSMEIVGTEVIDGVTLCKAVVEIDPVVEDIVKMEYLWSEEGDMVIWTSYDASGNVISKMTIIDGAMTITDENGEVMNFGMTGQ